MSPCIDENENERPFEVAVCPSCKNDDFKILHDSSIEAHKVKDWQITLQCNTCKAIVYIGGKNY